MHKHNSYKLLFLWLGLMTSAFSAHAQLVLRGKVVQANGSPLAGASVFLANTSLGTVAGTDGKFELGGIPRGRYELVVSNVGYQTLVRKLDAEEWPQDLQLILEPRQEELQEVVVGSYVKEDWKKWGQFFTESFIGTVPFAAQTRIRNTKAIEFRYYARQNRLVAFSREPLIIENKALGYRIRYQLEEFEFNYKTRVLFYAGFPLFEPLYKKEKVPARIAANRERVYYGSKMHFMRSLYRNLLEAEQYQLNRIYLVPNAAKAAARAYLRSKPPTGQQMRITIGSNGQVGPAKAGGPVTDSSAWAMSMMNQPDTLEMLDKNPVPADSIAFAVAPTVAGLYFEHRLQVLYRAGKEEASYLAKTGERRQSGPPTSTMWLTQGRPIEVLQDGSFFDAADMLVAGYWAWSNKIANLLPLDYKPPPRPDPKK